MKTPEEVERQNIDRTLAAAGWTIQDQNVVNLSAASGVAVRVFPLKGGFGSADYLLYVNGQAVGVVKVKAQGTTLTEVAVQTERYSVGLPGYVPVPIRRLPFL